MRLRFLYASAIVSFPAVQGETQSRKLDEAILTDILGEVLLYKNPDDDFCHHSKVTGDTLISQTIRDNVFFDDAFAVDESNLFQTEMVHTPGPGEHVNTTWSIRIGTGGNIYSYKTNLGEVMPPNIKKGMYMVDEVWQSVAVNTTLNDFPNAPWFIHQAGVYQKEDQTEQRPFWSSPSVARWCDQSVRECRFASWGQQAHVPTKYSSRALYINRYRDCGNGILQFTSLVHNFSEETRFNYMSLPWFGVRNTLYKDVMIRRDENDPQISKGKWITHYPNQFFGVSPRWLLPMTGGYTMFAQERWGRPEFQFPGNPYFGKTPQDQIPTWVIGDNIYPTDIPCHSDRIVSERYNSYHIHCRLAHGTANWSTGCKACNLVFENVATSETVDVVNIAHYADPKDEVAQGTLIYFGTAKGDMLGGKKMMEWDHAAAQTVLDDFLSVFSNGDSFIIKWKEGRSDDENHAIAYVHGVNKEIQEGIGGAQYWLGFARIEYGDANSFLRRFMVFNEVQLIKMDPGVTFGKNAFVIAGMGIDAVSEQADSVIESTIEDYNLAGDLPYRRLDVIVKDTEFGIAIDGEGCSGPFTCTGYTTPQIDVDLSRTKPYFYIEYCGETYFGPNIERYAHKDSDALRVYGMCTETDEYNVVTEKRPSMKLMGFFAESDCTPMEGMTYNSNYCADNPPSEDEMGFGSLDSTQVVDKFCGQVASS